MDEYKVGQAGLSIGSGLTSLIGGIQQAELQRMEAEYQKSNFEFNAKMMRFKKEEIESAGATEAAKVQARAIRFGGTQLVMQAANGNSLSGGDQIAVRSGTQAISNMDAMTIKNNAMRQAFGLEVGATDALLQSSLNSLSAENRANTSLLTGGLNAARHSLEAYKYLK